MAEEVATTQRNSQRNSNGPIIAIIILAIIVGFILDERPSMAGEGDAAGGRSDWFDETAFLSGLERRFDSPDFRGGAVTAFMGGMEIDLTDASFDREEAILDITSVMGGVRIRVPKSWTVVSRVDTVMGGFKDNTRRPNDGNKRLVLKGTVLMGGVEVSN
jgi:predicted membrane protein